MEEKQEDKKYCVIDCETNGLLEHLLDFSSFPYKLKDSAKLWCVVIKDVQTGEFFEAEGVKLTKEWLRKTLEPYTLIAAHNGVKFDFLVLQLFGLLDYTVGYLGQKDTVSDKEVVLVDTLILSRLFNPDRREGHSLESWGRKLGNQKTNLRKAYIDGGLIDAKAPEMAEFQLYNSLMLDYCKKDTDVTEGVLKELMKEMQRYPDWKQSMRIEHKLADLSIRRENFGYWFDKDLALKLVEDLTNKIATVAAEINPILPNRRMTKGELSNFTPPARQLKENGQPTSYLLNFVKQVGAELLIDEKCIMYGGKKIPLPFTEPLKTEVKATIEDGDAVKDYLIKLGWNPSAWNERDLTKDSKKKELPYKKRREVLERWIVETFHEERYKTLRLEKVGIKDEDELREKLSEKLNDNRPVIVPTTPHIRVGIERELCPNLLQLGEKVEFAKAYGDYLTYRYRLASIAGGDIGELTLSEEKPNSGYLSIYREADQRVATPAIEIGAISNRYIHKNIVNIPRTTSLYGKEMRSLFGSGKDFVQLGYDFSSLEARISGHYVYKYPEGEELAKMFVAEKPNDLHSVNSVKLGINRTIVKALTFAILYGAQPPKISKMLSVPLSRAKDLFNEFWETVPALKALKASLEKHWEKNNKEYIRGIDGRKIYARSQHSLLNFLFQSGGVICAKYVTVLLAQKLEQLGYCIDPFKAKPDVCSMIEYHDEQNLALNPKILKFQKFATEQEGKDFIKNWRDKYKLSQLSKGKNGWFVSLPNDVSKSVEDAIGEVGELLKLNIQLANEWAVGRNWGDTH